MLNITLNLIFSLLLPQMSKLYWHHAIITLLILLMLSSPSLLSSNLYFSNSSITATDFMSSTLILLTLWISCLMLLASYPTMHKNNLPKTFTVFILLLTLTLCLCFTASNFLAFYVWFEASLIPTTFLIMMWGYQPERLQASMYLVVYTVMASLPLLLMLCKIYSQSAHLSMIYPWIMFPENMNYIASWLMMTMAFLVKLPLFSVHLWLPKAHVEAPVAGSMILAAILLKLGGYGLMRTITLFPGHSYITYSPISSLALMGALITSLICLRQTDMKSLIAYSSVGHMGLMIAGILSNSQMGMFGGLAMMIAHGLISSGLFCLANITYEITHTRSMMLTKGLLTYLPMISLWWFILVCSNMAAPPSINLLGEIMLITASMSRALILMIPLGLISFITAAYSLFLFSAINHGWPTSASNPNPPFKPQNHLLILLHILPAILLILNPDIITNWL